ncbi:MAG TPA: hypothetical protein VF775_00920 [Geobacteraceae bacterium]
MPNPTLQEQIDGINRKLDLVLEEIALQQRHRREMEDLRDDLMRVARGIYKDAVQELEDVHDHLSTGDMLFLTKKLLRNVTTITHTIEQLESVRDFLQDAAPLARESFLELMNKLDEMDRKGYFVFFKEIGAVLDRVITTFSADDLRKLGDNIVAILNTVKNVTQPDMLQSINGALAAYRTADLTVPDDVTLLSVLKGLNSPEARRGLALTVQLLKSLATPEGAALTPANEQGANHDNER